MTVPAAPCRLAVFLSRKARVGVILRRGPSKWVQMIHWDRASDAFTPGQWFHGRVYERRCDLSPDGRLFFKGAEFVLPGFMDHLLDTYPVEDGKFYLLGVSNGGISAFRAGTLYPDRFRSITVVPGYPLDPDAARLAQLAELPVTMVVGERDGAWTERSQSTFDALTALGGNPHLVIVPDGDHFIYEGISPETLAAYILRR